MKGGEYFPGRETHSCCDNIAICLYKPWVEPMIVTLLVSDCFAYFIGGEMGGGGGGGGGGLFSMPYIIKEGLITLFESQKFSWGNMPPDPLYGDWLLSPLLQTFLPLYILFITVSSNFNLFHSNVICT